MNGKRLKDDAGVSIIIVALSLIVLMIFAAFAVDVGGVYAERRQDQTAADLAALAAAQDLQKGETTMVATAKQYAHETLGEEIPDGPEGWDSCPRPDPAALPVQATNNSCISYSDTRVRVRLPDRYYPATFGGVIGVDDYRHSAFAVAGLEASGFGGVLPFAVTGVSAQGGFGCLKSASNGQASAVCGSTSGNFGYLDFSHYGSTTLGTAQSCAPGDTQSRLEANMAMGVDHDLSKVGTVHLTPVVDTQGCTGQVPTPDAAMTETGNMSHLVTHGLFYRPGNKGGPIFPDGEPSRLRRHDDRLLDGAAPPRITVHTVDDLDNTALWRFIPRNYGPGQATPANIPTSCMRNQFVNASDAYYPNLTDNKNLPPSVAAAINNVSSERDRVLALLARCFAHYRGLSWDGSPILSLTPAEPPSGCAGACTDPVFAFNSSATDDPDLYDIQYTPRFGYVPVISDFPTGQSQARTFIRFRAVYIQRLVIDRQGSGETVWDPETAPVPPTSSGYQRVREVSVFVFPDGMLPGGLGGEEAPFEIGVNRFVTLVR